MKRYDRFMLTSSRSKGPTAYVDQFTNFNSPAFCIAAKALPYFVLLLCAIMRLERDAFRPLYFNISTIYVAPLRHLSVGPSTLVSLSILGQRLH